MLNKKQLEAYSVCPLALELVPESVARDFCVLPVSASDDAVHLVLPSTFRELITADGDTLDRLRIILDRTITYDVASRVELQPIVDLHYRAVYSAIQNCDVQFSFRCPKQWADLSPTEQSTVRYCNECTQNVYFCLTDDELSQRMANDQCAAFCDSETQSFVLGLLEYPER